METKAPSGHLHKHCAAECRLVTPHASLGNRIANILFVTEMTRIRSTRAPAGSNFYQPLPSNLRKLKKKGCVTYKPEAPRWPMSRLHVSSLEESILRGNRVPSVAWTTSDMDLAWKGVVKTSVSGFYGLLWLRPTRPHRMVHRLITSSWSGLPCLQMQTDRAERLLAP